MSDLVLADEPIDGPAASALIALVQQEYVTRYGGPDRTPVEAAEFAPPSGCFLVGYLDGDPVAMGGLRRRDEATVELKRMFVRADVRGRGLSRVVLAALEERARALGAGRIVLETGDRQPEAISLYTSTGFAPTDGFGYYACEPGAIHLAKDLAPVSE